MDFNFPTAINPNNLGDQAGDPPAQESHSDPRIERILKRSRDESASNASENGKSLFGRGAHVQTNAEGHKERKVDASEEEEESVVFDPLMMTGPIEGLKKGGLKRGAGSDEDIEGNPLNPLEAKCFRIDEMQIPAAPQDGHVIFKFHGKNEFQVELYEEKLWEKLKEALKGDKRPDDALLRLSDDSIKRTLDLPLSILRKIISLGENNPSIRFDYLTPRDHIRKFKRTQAGFP